MDHATVTSSGKVGPVFCLLIHLHYDRRRQLSALAAGVLALSIGIGEKR